MIFKYDLMLKVLAGKKTQTRRPAYEGEVAVDKGGHSAAVTWGELDTAIENIAEIVTFKGRTRFKAGKSVALQPGRGKAAPLVAALRTVDSVVRHIVTEDSGPFLNAMAEPARIVIDRIRFEDCRLISQADAFAEGFDSPADFLHVWCAFYDPKALYLHDQIGKFTVFEIASLLPKADRAVYLNDWIAALRKKRAADKYLCWPLDIRPER